jgi:Uma2 family endonuclease
MVTLPHQFRQPDGSLKSPPAHLPTMYDLPSESLEEPGLPDEFHDVQPQLLSRTLQLPGYDCDNYFTVSDLNIYYDSDHLRWYKRADWFLAVGVPHLYEGHDLRRSYVNWHEPRPPHVVVEFLSVGTEADDLGRFYAKAQGSPEDEPVELAEDMNEAEDQRQEKPPSKLVVYEQYLQVPHYLVYSRANQQLRYFCLVAGEYQEQSVGADNPLVWLEDLQIGLGIWEGMFNNIPGCWLRWCDRQGNWYLTDTERERLAKQQAEQQAQQERLAKQQAEQQAQQEQLAKQQAEQQAEQATLARAQSQAQLLQTARNLLATGMGLEQVVGLMNLSEAQIQQLNEDRV